MMMQKCCCCFHLNVLLLGDEERKISTKLCDDWNRKPASKPASQQASKASQANDQIFPQKDSQ